MRDTELTWQMGGCLTSSKDGLPQVKVVVDRLTTVQEYQQRFDGGHLHRQLCPLLERQLDKPRHEIVLIGVSEPKDILVTVSRFACFTGDGVGSRTNSLVRCKAAANALRCRNWPNSRGVEYCMDWRQMPRNRAGKDATP